MDKHNNSGPALRRSLLFTPGLRTDRYAKALSGAADMVCIDLEDGVAPDFKIEARDKAIPALFDTALDGALVAVSAMDSATRLEARYQKFRSMGNLAISESQ